MARPWQTRQRPLPAFWSLPCDVSAWDKVPFQRCLFRRLSPHDCTALRASIASFFLPGLAECNCYSISRVWARTAVHALNELEREIGRLDGISRRKVGLGAEIRHRLAKNLFSAT